MKHCIFADYKFSLNDGHVTVNFEQDIGNISWRRLLFGRFGSL